MNRIATLAITFVLFLPATGLGQTRSRTTRRSTQSSKTAKSSSSQAAEETKTTAANKVADQIKNLTRFVYLLGGVAKGIEQVDEAARKNEASPAALQQNDQNKAVVKTSQRNVRERVDQLDVYFRGTPEPEGN